MKYKYTPKTRQELIAAIEKEVKKRGLKCDLNCIDVSRIVDMSYIFGADPNGLWHSGLDLTLFNGDISQWDVSNVTIMKGMFRCSKFNGDISQWNVSKVMNMERMFNFSNFNGDISQWDVSSVQTMWYMFEHSFFNKDISNWNVSNVLNMMSMFSHSKFNGDLSQWDISKVEHMMSMFSHSEFNGDLSQWNVSNVKDMESMFQDSKFNGDISQWNVSNVKDMRCMFEGSTYERDISNWDNAGAEKFLMYSPAMLKKIPITRDVIVQLAAYEFEKRDIKSIFSDELIAFYMRQKPIIESVYDVEQWQEKADLLYKMWSEQDAPVAEFNDFS